MLRVAVISVHGCPVARLGEKDTGGMNAYLLQVARDLGQRGVRVDIYTRCHDPRDPEVVPLGPNARVVHLYAGSYSATKVNMFHHLPRFIYNLQRFREEHGLSYDIVHSHYWLSGHVGNILAQRWGVPLVAQFHTLAEVKRRARVGEREPAWRANVERKVVSVADRVIAVSPHEQEALARFYAASPDRVTVVPCGVDTQLFHPIGQQKARHHLGLAARRVVLYVGRIEPLKGVELLIRTMARLERDDGVQLLVVGGDLHRDRYLARLRALARELGLSPRVHFWGAVPQGQLPYFYNAADVCVVPSYYESFGLVALEAMACGTPVVARRVGGLRDVVRDGYTGYLIPWHCPEPFAQRLEMLLASESLRKAMGRAGRAWAKEWSWDLVATRVREVYQELLAAPLAVASGE